MSDSDEPKIIVDEEWKSQVEKEKEQLREQEQSAEAEAPTMPPASFEVLLATLGTQAMAMLGLLPNAAGDGPSEVNLPMARHLIDTIAVLEEKTKGNLTDEEAGAINQHLHQLRMTFVQVSQNQSTSKSESKETKTSGTIELP